LTNEANKYQKSKNMIFSGTKPEIPFAIFEGLFNFVVLPVLTVVMFIWPVALFFAIRKESAIWPLIVASSVGVFFVIIGLKYTFKRYILEGKSFTQFLLDNLDTKRKAEIAAHKKQMSEKLRDFYERLDNVQQEVDRVRATQTIKAMNKWIKENGLEKEVLWIH
jgi:hypothetical protein